MHSQKLIMNLNVTFSKDAKWTHTSESIVSSMLSYSADVFFPVAPLYTVAMLENKTLPVHSVRN